MKKIIYFTSNISNFQLLALSIAVVIIFNCQLNAQPTIEWSKCLGGSGDDYAYSVFQTSDSGYVVAGYSNSTNGDVSGNHGLYDMWVVKLTSTGTIQWQKNLGGSAGDYANSIIQTSDGGYIVAGNTRSNDSDVSGNHSGINFTDAWIVKLSANGNIQWQKCLGGTNLDYAYSIQQTKDGGYIVAGSTASNDGDVTNNHGQNDYWVVKFSSDGAIQWQKCLGGTGADDAYSISQTFDGGYIVAGSSISNDGEVSGNHGSSDYWIVKLNQAGDILWQKSLGGSAIDRAKSIIQTNDSGFVVSGYSSSNDSNVSGNQVSSDYWIVKLNSSGNLQWQKCLGGSKLDINMSIQKTFDNGCIIAGYTDSNDGDIAGNHGNDDYFITKINSAGNVQWQKCLGGSDIDDAFSIQQTFDGGFIVAGFSKSNDNDVVGNHGGFDYWLVKLSPEPKAVEELAPSNAGDFSFKIEPNPASGYISISFNKGACSLVGDRIISIYNFLGI